MNNPRMVKRLKKELDNINSDKMEGVRAALIDEDDFFNFNLLIDGPKGSPYEGGVFTVNVNCSDNYPNKCPKVKVMTKIYHCNIRSNTGELCTAAIEDEWVPTKNTTHIIKALKEILEHPNIDAPLEA